MRRQGYVWRQTYHDGVPDAPLEKGEATDETGTTITFWPSADDLRDRRVRLRDAAHPLPADGVPQQGPAHHAHRRASDVGVETRTTADRAAAAHDVFLYERGLVDYVEYLNRVEEGRARQRRDHRLRVRGHRAQDRARGRDAVDHALHRERPHLREHDQHPRGRHPRRGLPRRADHARQQVRAREGHPQGEGREPLRRRRARGTHRGHLGQARRAAVRGPDQDQARQHRGEGVRAEGRRRPARRLVRPQPDAGARRHPQGDPGVATARLAARKARETDPPQGPARVRRHARQAQGLLEQGPVDQRDLPRRGRLGRRLRRAGPRPARPRRSCRCAARSSTSRRRGSTARSATTRSRR